MSSTREDQEMEKKVFKSLKILNTKISNILNLSFQDADGSLGGRLGVYVHSQEQVTWSKMTTVCL